jgi:hypothetical protein
MREKTGLFSRYRWDFWPPDADNIAQSSVFI